MLDLLQHFALIVGMLHLLHPDDLRLLENLDGVESLIVFRLNEMYSSEATSAQCALNSEIGQGVFPFRRPRGSLHSATR